MKPETSQIVANLETLTDGLFYSLVGDEPYKLVTWETEAGEFTLENFLLAKSALVSLNPTEFLSEISQNQNESVIKQYQELLALLQSKLSYFGIYSYSLPKLPDTLFHPDEDLIGGDKLCIPILIGSTSSGDWVGFAPKQYAGNRSMTPPQFLIPELSSIKEDTAALINQVTAIIDRLVYSPPKRLTVSSENPLWARSITENRATILEKLMDDALFIDIQEVDRFFHIDEKEKEEFSAQELDLIAFLKSKLLNTRAYNLGFNFGENYTVHYVLGQTENGDRVGLVTDSFTF